MVLAGGLAARSPGLNCLASCRRVPQLIEILGTALTILGGV